VNNYLKNNPKLEHNGLIKRGALAVTSRPNVRGKLSCFNATSLAAYLKSREGRGAFNNADPCAACCAFFGVCTRHGLRRIEMLEDDKYEVSADWTRLKTERLVFDWTRKFVRWPRDQPVKVYCL